MSRSELVLIGFHVLDGIHGHPTRQELDENISKDQPVFIIHISSHLAIANSKALELANQGPSWQPPKTSNCHFDYEKGLMLEPECFLRVLHASPLFQPEYAFQALEEATRAYAKAGFTTANNGYTQYLSMLMFRAITRGAIPIKTQDKILSTRIVVWPNEPAGETILKQIEYGTVENWKEYFFDFDPNTIDKTSREFARVRDVGNNITDVYYDASHEDPIITVGAVKFLVDGSIQGFTGNLINPYHTCPIGCLCIEGYEEPESCHYSGCPTLLQRELVAKLAVFHKRGIQVAIHANGDGAIQSVLEAYNVVRTTTQSCNGHESEASSCALRYIDLDARPIIIHAQMAHPAPLVGFKHSQLEQMAEMNMIPSFFPLHIYYWGKRHRDVFVGPKRSVHLSPINTAQKLGIKWNMHCDSPVVPIDSLLLLWSACNRQYFDDDTQSLGDTLGEDQRVPIYEALKGITINGAYQYFMENQTGSIEVGKYADFVILSQDVLSLKKVYMFDEETKKGYYQYDETYVAETIMGGKSRYCRQSLWLDEHHCDGSFFSDPEEQDPHDFVASDLYGHL